MGVNSVFKGLNTSLTKRIYMYIDASRLMQLSIFELQQAGSAF